ERAARSSSPRRNRRKHRQDQRQNPARRANENPHHVRDRKTRHGSRCCERPRPRQGESRRQTTRRSDRGRFGVDPRTASLAVCKIFRWLTRTLLGAVAIVVLIALSYVAVVVHAWFTDSVSSL